ncbi:hypothetical protein Desku_0923 [Desulfofundulus kuznetsovii DSM 6115]|uniref:Uncharacterized protein n=1 Tax=Desulfofundulus kuznetsovii (strain DSM 6115 / VKM B-1805 / 17) TaxID=760568 RepID=A0AAU8P9A9_DESK7|nr:hypothetical protein Desku_0923 [Desulfofundulus kuznetsovii DSM 6115]
MFQKTEATPRCPGCGRELPNLTPEILKEWEEYRQKNLQGSYPCGGNPEWHDEEAKEVE